MTSPAGGLRRGLVHAAAVWLAACICLVAAACGGAGTGAGPVAPPPSATPGSSSPGAGLTSPGPASPAGTPVGVVAIDPGAATVVSVDRSAPAPPPLPYREFRRRGTWSLLDLTDRVAVFAREYGDAGLWLMDTTSGRMRPALERATASASGFWLSSARLSDSWLAWEEVGPGDDLVEAVGWRLCAAPLRRGALGIGRPLVVATGVTGTDARPFFDVTGSTIVWATTRLGPDGTAGVSQVTRRDLPGGPPQALYRSSGGVLGTVGVTGERVVVEENGDHRSPAAVIRVLDVRTGRRISSFNVGNVLPLSHWPAWRDGWLAWAEFPSEEATYPRLYLRDPAGNVYREGVPAVDPCFVGPYLVYQAQREERAGGLFRRIHEIRALRLADLSVRTLVAADTEAEGSWRAGIGMRSTERTLVTYLDGSATRGDARDAETVIRVYRLE